MLDISLIAGMLIIYPLYPQPTLWALCYVLCVLRKKIVQNQAYSWPMAEVQQINLLPWILDHKYSRFRITIFFKKHINKSTELKIQSTGCGQFIQNTVHLSFKECICV